MNNPYENFRWLIADIYSTLFFALYNKDEMYGTYEILNIYEANMDRLKVEDANVDDLTDLLTICVVRFVNISDEADIIDIPFRKLHMLYDNANKIQSEEEVKKIDLLELEVFALIDGFIPKNDDFKVAPVVINDVSLELGKILEVSKSFGNLGMQETFDALCSIDTLNQRRMKEDRRKKI